MGEIVRGKEGIKRGYTDVLRSIHWLCADFYCACEEKKEKQENKRDQEEENVNTQMFWGRKGECTVENVLKLANLLCHLYCVCRVGEYGGGSEGERRKEKWIHRCFEVDSLTVCRLLLRLWGKKEKQENKKKSSGRCEYAVEKISRWANWLGTASVENMREGKLVITQWCFAVDCMCICIYNICIYV